MSERDGTIVKIRGMQPLDDRNIKRCPVRAVGLRPPCSSAIGVPYHSDAGALSYTEVRTIACHHKPTPQSIQNQYHTPPPLDS